MPIRFQKKIPLSRSHGGEYVVSVAVGCVGVDSVVDCSWSCCCYVVGGDWREYVVVCAAGCAGGVLLCFAAVAEVVAEIGVEIALVVGGEIAPNNPSARLERQCKAAPCCCRCR